MKTDIRLAQHQLDDGRTVAEIWHDGQMVGTIYGGDECGVRIITKYRSRGECYKIDDLACLLMTIDRTKLVDGRPA